jgi:hypothetical protein
MAFSYILKSPVAQVTKLISGESEINGYAEVKVEVQSFRNVIGCWLGDSRHKRRA